MTDLYFGLPLQDDAQMPEQVKSSATNTPVATVQTDLTTAFTDYNTFAAAVIAITGDTFNTTTHQFTTGGATGLTHAQWATLAALLNTSLSDFVTAQTATTTAASATANSGVDVEVHVKLASSPTIQQVITTMANLVGYLETGTIAKPGLPL
jgi:hypothetical protein